MPQMSNMRFSGFLNPLFGPKLTNFRAINMPAEGTQIHQQGLSVNAIHVGMPFCKLQLMAITGHSITISMGKA